MKKKISLLLCVLASILCFTGCSGQKQELDYNKDSIKQAADFLIDYCTNTDDATLEQWKDMSEFSMNTQLSNAGLPFTPDSFLSALESWQAGVKECGAYVSHGDYKYEASRTEVKVTTTAEFKNRDAEITFIFDDNLYLDSMTVSGDYSRVEILKKAGLNTVLGMGTVFVVLIFISLIISLFKFIPVLQNAFTKKPEQAVEAPEAVETAAAAQLPEETADVTDDMELIAVISAAIAAAEGTSADGFVVRSIRRRPSNKWHV